MAKVHEEGIPLRAVLCLPGSCYDNLNKGLAGLFCHNPSANIETSTAKTMAILRETHLEDEEEIFSLDVKSLYTNVPVHEAIDLACDTLFTGDKTPPISRTTCHKLMELSNTNVWFMSGEDWYIQREGVAMGAAMAVILANVWMKTFEPALSSEMPELPKKPDNCCGKCGVKVTFRGYSIRCKVCCKWFHRKCTPFTVEELKRMTTSSCCCGCTVDEPRKGRGVFSRYMDDILRSAKP